jgi:hypothetical protein
MNKLTPHFSLEELTVSATAQRLGIDNTPPAEILPNIQVLAEGLERVRAALPIYNTPLHVDSGYRCLALNRAVGGAWNSAHMTGFSADITCGSLSPQEVCKYILGTGIKFDQLIYEGTWVHISFDPQMRGEVLVSSFGPGGTIYAKLG